MRLRNARPEDLSAIMLIEAENFAPEEAASKGAMAQRIDQAADSFLLVEDEASGSILAYVASVPCPDERLSDDLFETVPDLAPDQAYLAILSLSVLSDVKGQGLGTMLLAALKDLAQARGYRGISLTCHDYLVAYYEANGFVDLGYSASTHGGSSWIDMIWRPDAS